MGRIVWHGTGTELARLRNALARHCECQQELDYDQPRPCASHAMLGSQAALDHLLYAFRMRGVFVRREFYALRTSA